MDAGRKNPQPTNQPILARFINKAQLKNWTRPKCCIELNRKTLA